MHIWCLTPSFSNISLYIGIPSVIIASFGKPSSDDSINDSTKSLSKSSLSKIMSFMTWCVTESMSVNLACVSPFSCGNCSS